jgi:hypothetical protein
MRTRIDRLALVLAFILSACGVGGPTPEPSASTTSSGDGATASGTAEPTEVEPSLAAHAQVVPTPAGLLPPDSVARVVASGLRVRAEQPGLPGHDQIVYSLSVGDPVLVFSDAESYLPPEKSPDGRGWYRIHVGGASANSYADGGIDGWVAEGEDGLEWLTLEPLTCLGPATLALLLAPPGSTDEWATAWERLACQGAEPLQLEGVIVSRCFDAPETSYTFHPDFLASPSRCWGLVADDLDADGNLINGLNLDLSYPADFGALPQRGDLISVRGHFDDAASTTCTAETSFGQSLIDPEFLVFYCRERFVVDELTVTGHRDLAPLP